MTMTDDNLQTAITGEARARLKYTAFAMQAMQEGHPEIAQLFLEAAGAETIHGISHLRVAGGIGTTRQNLDESANGENDEIEEMYPRFIREAEAEGDTERGGELSVSRKARATSSRDVPGGLQGLRLLTVPRGQRMRSTLRTDANTPHPGSR